MPGGGFGADGEHADTLERIALEIHDGDPGLAERDLARYWRHVCDSEDLLAHVRRPEPRPEPPPELQPERHARRPSAPRRWRWE